MQKDIHLTFTTEEVNMILKGLGNLKFKDVYTLIAKIQQQASGQLNQNGTTPHKELETAPPLSN